MSNADHEQEENSEFGRTFNWKIAGRINPKLAAKLKRKGDLIIEEMRNSPLSFAGEHKLVIEIDTWGGEVPSACKIANTLRNLSHHGVTVVGVVTGCAYSCGLFILQQCDLRVMQPFSTLMFHSVRRADRTGDITYGYAVDLRSEQEECDEVFYRGQGRFVGRDKIQDLLDLNRDVFFDAENAFELGLVDEIHNWGAYPSVNE